MSDPARTPEAGEFWITTEAPGEGGAVVLTVRGDADLHTAPELRERISEVIDDGAEAIVLDLSETTLLDSMSLGVLLGAMKRLRARDATMRLVVSRHEVRRIFEITLLDRVFPIDETRADALREVSRGASLDGVGRREDLGPGVQRGDLEDSANGRIGNHE